MIEDWRMPYRSIDASGSPDSAGQVGWTWILDLARAAHSDSPAGLEIDNPPIHPNGNSCVVYRDRVPIAAYFVIRDPMNHAILFRWKAEG